jgi:hypothetical protein
MRGLMILCAVAALAGCAGHHDDGSVGRAPDSPWAGAYDGTWTAAGGRSGAIAIEVGEKGALSGTISGAVSPAADGHGDGTITGFAAPDGQCDGEVTYDGDIVVPFAGFVVGDPPPCSELAGYFDAFDFEVEV